MKKLVTLITSLLILTTIISPVFCDEEIIYVDIPNVDGITNKFTYTGEEIVYDIPDGEYYTITNNKQTDAGEYDAIAYLNSDKYLWKDGSDKYLYYHFTIEKADYDLSNVNFKDRAVIADGNEYSIYATNLPEGVSVIYNGENISEPGNYTIVAMLTGDNNHNQIDPLFANLYIIEKPTDIETLYSSLGSVTGLLPPAANIDTKILNKKEEKYKSISDALIKNTKVSENDILDVIDVEFTYSGIQIESNEKVTYSIKNPEEEKIDIYAVNVDENGNIVCEKIKYETNEDMMVFTTDISSDLVFVKNRSSYILYIAIAIGIIVVIVLAIFGIIKMIKNRKHSSVKFKSTKNRTLKKKSLYKKSNS